MNVKNNISGIHYLNPILWDAVKSVVEVKVSHDVSNNLTLPISQMLKFRLH